MHNYQRQATIIKGRGNNQEKGKREKSTKRRHKHLQNLMDRLALPPSAGEEPLEHQDEAKLC